MSAPKGNRFWEQRTKHGPNVLYSDPAKLVEAAIEYFTWCEDNPLLEAKVGFYEGMAIHTEVNKVRAMTTNGLCIYLGIGVSTFYAWKADRDDLAAAIEWIEQVIRDQKFSAAAAGLLNANIISRELGLKDTQVHEIATPQMIIAPPDGEAPPMPPIHGE